MKTLIRSILYIACIVPVACENDNNPSPYNDSTIEMGANSASDVYYSLATGEVNTVNRSEWDIAFSVPTQTAAVLINEGAGVELKCLGDTNAWESNDTTGLYLKQKLYNDKSGWTKGAFNVNAKPGVQTNFGWGHYVQSDHNVYGDSVYVIKLSNGQFKKFFYRERNGANVSHSLSWANLDGSDPVNTTVVTASYVGTRNFIHYSIVNQEIVEAEPLKEQWDLLFTRYIIQIPAGPGMILNYPVMGVLSNIGVTVAKVTGVLPASAVETDASGGYTDHADAIGYDWKVSDPVTHEVSLADSVSYFVKSVDGNKYQLYFTDYGGSPAGTISIKFKSVK
jgi:hypothetical protein